MRSVPTDEEKCKARQVREMFGVIAGRYDLLNHVLSGGIAVLLLGAAGQ